MKFWLHIQNSSHVDTQYCAETHVDSEFTSTSILSLTTIGSFDYHWQYVT